MLVSFFRAGEVESSFEDVVAHLGNIATQSVLGA
jgi:hypothetical protein